MREKMILKKEEKIINEMEIKFKALSINESFARASIAGFCLQINPSIDEITDIKTAVSEAVTNCIVHAYPNKSEVGEILAHVKLFKDGLEISIRDFGIGIIDLDKARQPFFTSKPNSERSGMGFTVMESFMDSVKVLNNSNGGLEVVLYKQIKNREKDSDVVGI